MTPFLIIPFAAAFCVYASYKIYTYLPCENRLCWAVWTTRVDPCGHRLCQRCAQQTPNLHPLCPGCQNYASARAMDQQSTHIIMLTSMF